MIVFFRELDVWVGRYPHVQLGPDTFLVGGFLNYPWSSELPGSSSVFYFPLQQ